MNSERIFSNTSSARRKQLNRIMGQLFALGLMALFLASCSSNDTATGPYGGGGNGGGGNGGGGTSPATVVNVTLKDFSITMPATLNAGNTDFKVTNSGATVHNFEIQGNGIDQKLSSNLNPGGSGDLTVNLTAGTYHVFCPVDGHAGMGMTTQVTVSTGTTSSGGTGGGY